MTLDQDRGKPQQQNDSPEKAFLSDLLAGSIGGTSEQAKEAQLERQVADAIATLDEAKKIVANRLFGLDGHQPSSHEEIATLLTDSLDESLKAQLAFEKGEPVEDFVFSVTEVEKLEAEMLRDLRGV